MISTAFPQRSHDHRIRELIAHTGKANLFPDLNIPRPTALGWTRSQPKEVVTVKALDKTERELHLEILKLQRRVWVLTAIMHLLLVLLRISRFRLDEERLPEGRDKSALLVAIDLTFRT